MAGVSQQTPFVVPSRRSFTIGRYTLDIAQSMLVCDEVRIALRPQVLRVLEAIATDGGAISKKQLGAAIWGVGASDHLLGNPLNQVISDTRATLESTPDLRLERQGGAGYVLKVLDRQPTPAAKIPGPGEKFPLDYFLEPHVRLANCKVSDLHCVVAAPEALELDERFARASFAHMKAGARLQMVLPAQRSGKVGKLLFQLIATGLPDEGANAVLQARFDVLREHFRLRLVHDELLEGLHLRTYGGGLDRNAISVILLAGNEGVVNSQGSEASRLHEALQAKALPFGQKPIVGLGGAGIEKLRSAVYEEFRKYEFIADQLIARCE